MSKTDKTAPYHVVTLHSGVEHHDHRLGACVMESEHEPQRWSHTCAKRVEVTTTCTKAEPRTTHTMGRYVAGKGFVPGTTTTCWERRPEYAVSPNGGHVYRDNPVNGRFEAVVERWIVTQCQGHAEWSWDEVVPCVCDTWGPRPTCSVEPPYTHKWRHHRSASDDYKRTRGGENRKAIAEGLADLDEDDPRSPWRHVGLKAMRRHYMPLWERELLGLTTQTRRTTEVRPVPKEAPMHNPFLSEGRRQTVLTRQAIERQTARRTPYVAQVERDAPAGVIRRPRVAKQPFSRTAEQAAREDGVDTSVTVRRIG